MSDIVERLGGPFMAEAAALRAMDDATEEIERLRAGLHDCMQEAANHHRENEARAKLGGSDMAQRKAKAIVARSGVLLHNIKAIARAALGER